MIGTYSRTQKQYSRNMLKCYFTVKNINNAGWQGKSQANVYTTCKSLQEIPEQQTNNYKLVIAVQKFN